MKIFYTDHDFQVDLENFSVKLEISCKEKEKTYFGIIFQFVFVYSQGECSIMITFQNVGASDLYDIRLEMENSNPAYS